MKKYFIDKFFQQTICIAIFYKPFKTSTSPNAFRNCFFPYPGNSSSIIISSSEIISPSPYFGCLPFRSGFRVSFCSAPASLSSVSADSLSATHFPAFLPSRADPPAASADNCLVSHMSPGSSDLYNRKVPDSSLHGSVLRRTDGAPLLPVLCFCSEAGSVPDSFR